MERVRIDGILKTLPFKRTFVFCFFLINKRSSRVNDLHLKVDNVRPLSIGLHHI